MDMRIVQPTDVRETNFLCDSLLSNIREPIESPLMQDILAKVLNLAKLDSPIILIGEVGSGKKRIAQIMHENSSRACYPFYSFYCMAISDEEYEEAFQEKLHLSDEHFLLTFSILENSLNGVLFLDHFSELPDDVMIKLINAYKKGCDQLFRYNKSARPRLVISISMEHYAELVEKENWHTVLQMLDFYTIVIPPLRERKEDIPSIIRSFIASMQSQLKRFRNLNISDAALVACMEYNWPGNILELHNSLYQGALFSDGKTIETYHLPIAIGAQL